MPITLEQLKKRQAQDPVRFRQDQIAMMAFSKLLYTVGTALFRGEDDDEAKIGKKLRAYSDDVSKLCHNPSNPSEQEGIDEALDRLADFGDYLGKAKEKYSNQNICTLLREQSGAELLEGLKAFERFCGFGIDVQNLYDGTPDQSTQEEREARQELLPAISAFTAKQAGAALAKRSFLPTLACGYEAARVERLSALTDAIDAPGRGPGTDCRRGRRDHLLRPPGRGRPGSAAPGHEGPSGRLRRSRVPGVRRRLALPHLCRASVQRVNIERPTGARSVFLHIRAAEE